MANLNAEIRAWATANGMEIPKNGNVPPEIAMAYATREITTPKKEKKVKKEKATNSPANSDAKALHAEFGEIFSAGTINHVIGQHPNRAREILVTGQDFLDNGMRSRYAAIRKAIAGDEVKRKAETPATATATASPSAGKGKGTKAPKDAVQTPVRYGVVLAGGVLISVGSLEEQKHLLKSAPGSTAVELH